MAVVSKNLRSAMSSRCNVAASVSRRSTVTVRAVKTEKGKTITGAKDLPTAAQDSQRVGDVLDYLRTLPGQGPRSGPFQDVWDPANLTTSANIAEVRRWRESEITHGRVAMLAAVGFVVQEQLEDNPMFFNWDGHIRGQAIHQFDDVQAGFWEPLLICIGLAESYRVSLGWAPPTGNGFGRLYDDYEMGNLYFDPLGLKPKDETALFDMQSKELNNGRLAMIAVAIFTIQELAQPGVQIFDRWFVDAGETAKDVTNQLPSDLPTPKLPNPQNLPNLPRLPGQNISWALGEGPKPPSIQDLPTPDLPNAPKLPSLQDLPKPQDLKLPGFGGEGPKLPSAEDLPTPRLPGQDISWALGGGPKPNSNLPGSSDMPNVPNMPNLPNAPKLPSAEDLPKPQDLKLPGFGGQGPKLPSPQDLLNPKK